MPEFSNGVIDQNADKLLKPFETPSIVNHFIFSYGKLLGDCYQIEEHIDLIEQAEAIVSYLCWKAGYKFYAPNQKIAYKVSSL